MVDLGHKCRNCGAALRWYFKSQGDVCTGCKLLLGRRFDFRQSVAASRKFFRVARTAVSALQGDLVNATELLRRHSGR